MARGNLAQCIPFGTISKQNNNALTVAAAAKVKVFEVFKDCKEWLNNNTAMPSYLIRAQQIVNDIRIVFCFEFYPNASENTIGCFLS